MSADAVPVAVLFALTIFIVMLSIEMGCQFGRVAHKRSEDEKESPVPSVW